MKKTHISTVLERAFRESAKITTIDQLRRPVLGAAAGHRVFTTLGAQNVFETMERLDSMSKYNVGHPTPWSVR